MQFSAHIWGALSPKGVINSVFFFFWNENLDKDSDVEEIWRARTVTDDSQLVDEKE